MLPLELRLGLVALLIAAAAAAGLVALGRHDDVVKAAAVAPYAQAAASASEAARARESQDRAAQVENANETERIAARDHARMQADYSAAGAAAQRLRDVIAAGGRPVPGSPAAAAECPADRDRLAAALAESVERHRRLAADADAAVADARRRGLECEADYDALSRGAAPIN